MKAKVRPGVHYAAVPGGVCFAHGEKSFVIAGPPALYELVDVSLGALVDGADAQSLAHAIGAPQAEPVFDRLLTALLDRDVAFDVETLTPAPSTRDADRFEEALRWCEDHCADPYAAFAALRAARVVVVGAGPAIEPLRRTLESFGVDEVIVVDRVTQLENVATPGATPVPVMMVVVDDVHIGYGQSELRATADWPHVRVIVGEAGAVVGAPSREPQQQAWVAALARRAFHRIAIDPAAYPLSAVLAGSLAAHTVLHQLAGPVVTPMQATVVHGRLLSTSVVPYPQRADTDELTNTQPDSLSVSRALELAQPLLAPLCGLFRRGDDTNVAQLPMSLATIELPDTTPPARVAAWGRDRESATFEAVLGGLRTVVEASGDTVGMTSGAGSTWARANLDARLRALTPGVFADDGIESRAIEWRDLSSSRTQSLWSLLDDFYRFTLSVELRELDANSWSVVTVRADGVASIQISQWAPTRSAAIYHALAAAVAIAQSDGPTAELLAAEPIGINALARSSSEQVLAGLRATQQYASRTGRRWVEQQYTSDCVVGTLPLACGWSRLT